MAANGPPNPNKSSQPKSSVLTLDPRPLREQAGFDPALVESNLAMVKNFISQEARQIFYKEFAGQIPEWVEATLYNLTVLGGPTLAEEVGQEISRVIQYGAVHFGSKWVASQLFTLGTTAILSQIAIAMGAGKSAHDAFRFIEPYLKGGMANLMADRYAQWVCPHDSENFRDLLGQKGFVMAGAKTAAKAVKAVARPAIELGAKNVAFRPALALARFSESQLTQGPSLLGSLNKPFELFQQGQAALATGMEDGYYASPIPELFTGFGAASWMFFGEIGSDYIANNFIRGQIASSLDQSLRSLLAPEDQSHLQAALLSDPTRVQRDSSRYALVALEFALALGIVTAKEKIAETPAFQKAMKIRDQALEMLRQHGNAEVMEILSASLRGRYLSPETIKAFRQRQREKHPALVRLALRTADGVAKAGLATARTVSAAAGGIKKTVKGDPCVYAQKSADVIKGSVIAAHASDEALDDYFFTKQHVSFLGNLYSSIDMDEVRRRTAEQLTLGNYFAEFFKQSIKNGQIMDRPAFIRTLDYLIRRLGVKADNLFEGLNGIHRAIIAINDEELAIVLPLLLDPNNYMLNTQFGAENIVALCAYFNRFETLRLLFVNPQYLPQLQKMLLQANRNGDTPLHHAFTQGNYVLAAFLINQGASLSALNYYGITPLDQLRFLNPEQREICLAECLPALIRRMDMIIQLLSNIPQKMVDKEGNEKIIDYLKDELKILMSLSVKPTNPEALQQMRLPNGRSFMTDLLLTEGAAGQRALEFARSRLAHNYSSADLPSLKDDLSDDEIRQILQRAIDSKDESLLKLIIPNNLPVDLQEKLAKLLPPDVLFELLKEPKGKDLILTLIKHTGAKNLVNLPSQNGETLLGAAIAAGGRITGSIPYDTAIALLSDCDANPLVAHKGITPAQMMREYSSKIGVPILFGRNNYVQLHAQMQEKTLKVLPKSDSIDLIIAGIKEILEIGDTPQTRETIENLLRDKPEYFNMPLALAPNEPSLAFLERIIHWDPNYIMQLVGIGAQFTPAMFHKLVPLLIPKINSDLASRNILMLIAQKYPRYFDQPIQIGNKQIPILFVLVYHYPNSEYIMNFINTGISTEPTLEGKTFKQRWDEYISSFRLSSPLDKDKALQLLLNDLEKQKSMVGKTVEPVPAAAVSPAVIAAEVQPSPVVVVPIPASPTPDAKKPISQPLLPKQAQNKPKLILNSELRPAKVPAYLAKLSVEDLKKVYDEVRNKPK